MDGMHFKWGCDLNLSTLSSLGFNDLRINIWWDNECEKMMNKYYRVIWNPNQLSSNKFKACGIVYWLILPWITLFLKCATSSYHFKVKHVLITAKGFASFLILLYQILFFFILANRSLQRNFSIGSKST